MRVGDDSRSVRNPSRAAPAAAMMSPVRIASSAAAGMAASGLSAANGASATSTSGTNDESGPSISSRDGPTTA